MTCDTTPSTPPGIRLAETSEQLPHDFERILSLQFLRLGFDDAVDTSYIETLCRRSTLVRNSVLACISMSMPTNSADDAWKLYNIALGDMSTQLSTDTSGECNDDTLTAAVWLCIFEVSGFLQRRSPS